MKSILFNLLRKIPHTVINDECAPTLGPLLFRWFLFRSPWVTVMLHCFLRSDNDRAFHDHPWDFISFLLTPYVEHTPYGVFEHKRFSIVMRPAEWRHWVETLHPKTWTLVVHFRRRRVWGFITASGWISWRNYVGDRCQ